VENPTADADAVCDQGSDQWSVPLEVNGLLFYAVVRDSATVIVLRLISFTKSRSRPDASRTHHIAVDPGSSSVSSSGSQ